MRCFLHCTAPLIATGVEVTVYRQARLLTQAGYQVRAIAEVRLPGNK
jgi:hypothetical protein